MARGLGARERYFATPGWKEAECQSVYGRPVMVWRERLRHARKLAELAPPAPERELLVHGHRRITYGSWARTVESAAAELHRRGLRSRDRVLVLAHNSPETFLAPWALWRLGAVPVLGNRWWAPAEIAEATAVIRPAAVITDLERSPAGEDVQLIGIEEMRRWWEVPAVGGPLNFGPAADEDEVALILFTAGSTGAPKGVQLSHRNLIATHHNMRVLLGGGPLGPVPHPQPVTLLTVPLFHYGALRGAAGVLIDGAKVVIPEGRFDPLQVLQLIEREHVTAWNAVPTQYKRVFDHPDFGRYDLSSLTSPSTGGAMVPRALVEAIPRRLPGAVNGLRVAYGMSECGTVTIVAGVDLVTRPGVVGKPITNVEVKIDQPGPDGEGEVLIRSAQTMIGYLDAARQPFDDGGWYHSGDLGRFDADGYLYITGRSSDMVIRGGENVSCPNVEAAITAHPAVLEAAAFGIPDDDLGEAVAAVVVVRSLAAVGEAELRAFAGERLARFEVPSRWVLRTEPLPTLEAGKVDKRRLQAALLGAVR